MDASDRNEKTRKDTDSPLAKFWGFIAWYLPLCISTATERAFPSFVCLFFNRWATVSRGAAIIGLILIPLALLRSRNDSPPQNLLRGVIFIDAFASWILGILQYPLGAGSEFYLDYLSFFWEPFFDLLGIRLSDPILYAWGRLAPQMLPLFALSFGSSDIFAAILKKAGSWTRNSAASPPSLPQTNPQPGFWSMKVDLKRNIPLPVVLAIVAAAGIATALLLPSLGQRNHMPDEAEEISLPDPLSMNEAFSPSNTSNRIFRAETLLRYGDIEDAYRFFAKSARDGDAKGMAALAGMYFDGYPLPTRSAAFHWLKKALENYDLDALRVYIQAVDRGRLRGVGGKKRFDLHRLGAQNGDGYSMTELGLDYLRGRNAKRSFETGLEWLKKAADAGDPYGLTELGFLYYRGDRVGRDWNKATQLFREAGEAIYANRNSLLERRIREYTRRIEEGIALHDWIR